VSAARRRWRELALAAGSLVALLGLGEGVARLLPFGVAPPQRPLPPEWRELPKIEGMWDMLRPNARGLQAGALFKNNSAGFRGPERSEAKAPGTFRIAVLGDSVAMGHGVAYEDAYPSRLERALAGRTPGRRYEVLDFGVGGLNAPAVIDRLGRLALRYDPDLLVWGYELNDIEGPHYRRTVDLEHTNALRFGDSPSYLWRHLAPRLLSLQELLFAPRGSYTHELDDNYFENPRAFRAVEKALGRLALVAERKRICAALLLDTRLYYLHALHPFRRHYEKVAAAARRRGLPVIESFEAHRGLRPEAVWVGLIDSHPNALGHEVLAEVLLDGLRRLPASCWKGAPPP
jgi:lysophospholipase L1-like esterase